MNKIFLAWVAVVTLIIVAVGYFLYMGNQNQQQSQPESLNNEIKIENFAFNPASLEIKVGAIVTWTNNDSSPHQIKSDNFNSSVLNKGEKYQFTFSEAGEYDYSCAIHTSMKGKIIVTK
jgi:plastocyanin